MGNSLWSTVRDLGARAGLCAFVHLATFGRREDRQLRHRKMPLGCPLPAPACVSAPRRRWLHRCKKGCTLLRPFAEQLASELGNLPGHGVEFEAAQKLLCLGLLAWVHTHENLSDVHRATGEKSILMGKLCENRGAAVPIIQRYQSGRSNRASRSFTVPASFQRSEER